MTKRLFLAVAGIILSVSALCAKEKLVTVSTAKNINTGMDMKAYRTIAKFASEIGATGMEMSQIEPSMWQWNNNRFDPYPCWSMHRGSVFKFIVPKQLEPYIPADYTKRNVELLKKHAAILKEYGLKGYFEDMDPAYLPEQAYLDHPSWRGPRCDQARRARTEYYAPCIDDPEMRDMFVNAVTDLCKIVPVENVHILCNDSGAGLCWYEDLYPGPNGPSKCKNISVDQRILNFLDMWQNGASKAGVNMKVNLSHTTGHNSVIPRMKDGQSLNGKTASGAENKISIGSPSWYGTYFAPVSLVPAMVMSATQLQQAQKSNSDIFINIRGDQEIDLMRFLKMYMNKPIGEGQVAKYKALNAVAATFVGETESEKLVGIWEDIQNVWELIAPFNTGGSLYELGTQHQRWMTRPFVAFPEELKAEELNYWRDFIFQAQTEKEALDMLDLQGHRWLDGYGGYFILRNVTNIMLKTLDSSIKKASALESKGVDAESSKYLKALTLRLKFLVCVAKNAINAVEFQWIMDTAPKTGNKEDKSLRNRWQGDVELERLNQITRDEIDNCHEIIALLDAADAAGIDLCVKVHEKRFEQVLYFGPDIQDQLRRKISIMEAHRRDFLRIWRSKNI